MCVRAGDVGVVGGQIDAVWVGFSIYGALCAFGICSVHCSVLMICFDVFRTPLALLLVGTMMDVLLIGDCFLK